MPNARRRDWLLTWADPRERLPTYEELEADEELDRIRPSGLCDAYRTVTAGACAGMLITIWSGVAMVCVHRSGRFYPLRREDCLPAAMLRAPHLVSHFEPWARWCSRPDWYAWLDAYKPPRALAKWHQMPPQGVRWSETPALRPQEFKKFRSAPKRVIDPAHPPPRVPRKIEDPLVALARSFGIDVPDELTTPRRFGRKR